MACELCKTNHQKAIVSVSTDKGEQGPFKAEYCSFLNGWLVNPHNEGFAVKAVFFPSPLVRVMEKPQEMLVKDDSEGQDEVMRIGE